MANTQARTAADIEKEIAAARDSLAEGVAALIDQVHPKAIARRGIADARTFADAKFARARAEFTDDAGNLATKRIAILGAAVAGIIAFILVIRAIARR